MTISCHCGNTTIIWPDDSPITFGKPTCWNCPKTETKPVTLRIVKEGK